MCDMCNAPEHKGITEEQRQAICAAASKAKPKPTSKPKPRPGLT